MENVPNNAFKNSEDIEVREQLSEEKYNTEYLDTPSRSNNSSTTTTTTTPKRILDIPYY
jgi:hypothetical protein